MASETKFKIFELLTDGNFHSGEMIGQLLGISRAAVSKHIKDLAELGLDIYSVTGKGYKLSKDIDLLSSETIQSYLATPQQIETKHILASTNDYVMENIRNESAISPGFTVFAEAQSEGKGRRGRMWQSPLATNIYMSQYRVLDDGLGAASALSLAVGIAVANTLMEFTEQKVELKWPNDILIANKKISGVLIEAEGQAEGLCHLVIGIGINVDMPVQASEKIDQPWTDLTQITTQEIKRNQLAARLIHHLQIVFDEYSTNRFVNLVATWNQLNAFKDNFVKLTSSKKIQSGICRGADESGALIIEDQGKTFKVYGGEISLRGDS